MTLVGNILLAIAAFLFIALLSAVYGTAPRGGDAAMGWVWGLIFINLAFLVVMGIVTLIVGHAGGLDWISPSLWPRVGWAGSTVFAGVLITALAALFKNEHGPVPGLLRWYGNFVPVLVPLILILAAGVLLNAPLREAMPQLLYKGPLLVVWGISAIGLLSALAGGLAEQQRGQQVKAAAMVEAQDANHARILQDIDSCKVETDMVFILVFTDANQRQDIREKALAKIKTNPRWQQELIRLLQSEGWAPEAFNFLASNPVEDSSLFPEAVKAGVLHQAALIREDIRRASHPSHLYPDLFYWEVERALRTVDRFAGMGVDYRPAVQELRAALDEPAEVDKPQFRCQRLLDDWLAQHA